MLYRIDMFLYLHFEQDWRFDCLCTTPKEKDLNCLPGIEWLFQTHQYLNTLDFYCSLSLSFFQTFSITLRLREGNSCIICFECIHSSTTQRKQKRKVSGMHSKLPTLYATNKHFNGVCAVTTNYKTQLSLPVWSVAIIKCKPIYLLHRSKGSKHPAPPASLPYQVRGFPLLRSNLFNRLCWSLRLKQNTVEFL